MVKEDFQRKSTDFTRIKLDDFQNFDIKHTDDTKLDTYVRLSSIGTFYEGLGVLVKNGQVKPELVDDLMSHSIIDYWEKIRPFILQQRKERNYPIFGEWTEYLYDQIKPIYDKQHPELAP